MIPTWQDTWLLIKLPSGASKKQINLVVNGRSSHTVRCNGHQGKGSSRQAGENGNHSYAEWSSKIPPSQWCEHQNTSKNNFPETQNKTEIYSSFLSSIFSRSKSLRDTATLQFWGSREATDSPQCSLLHTYDTETFPHLEFALQPAVTSGVLPCSSLPGLVGSAPDPNGRGLTSFGPSPEPLHPFPALLQHWWLPDGMLSPALPLSATCNARASLSLFLFFSPKI